MIGWTIRRVVRITVFVLIAPLLALRTLLDRLGGQQLLVLRLHEGVPWFPEQVPSWKRWIGSKKTPKVSMFEALEVMEEAERAPKLQAVLLELDRAQLSLAMAEALLEAIDRLKAKGKKVLVWADGLGAAALVVSAAADEAYGLPEGQIEFLGLRVRAVFVHDLLGILGVVPDLDHHGDYKTFSDMFTDRTMSEAHREMATDLGGDLFEQVVTPMIMGRQLQRDDVLAAIDAGPLANPDAAERKLIDGLLYLDQTRGAAGKLLGLEPKKRKKKDKKPAEPEVQAQPESEKPGAPGQPGQPAPEKADEPDDPPEPSECSPERLLARKRRRLWIQGVFADRQNVRIIDLHGGIIPGETGRGCPALAAVRAMDEAREARNVAAVVLRIDSPGGSALASDIMWRGAKRLAKEKPTVASVGDVCASGGYYLAVAASKIVAPAASLVGSIGVVSGKFHLAPALHRWGVRFEGVPFGARAGMFDPDRGFTPEEAEANHQSLMRFYETFLARVAEGRGMTRDQVDAIAQGRVYTGRRAHALGLVDVVGDLGRAVREVCALAGISRPPIIQLAQPNRPGFAEQLDPRNQGALAEGLGALTLATTLAREPALAYCPWRVEGV